MAGLWISGVSDGWGLGSMGNWITGALIREQARGFALRVAGVFGMNLGVWFDESFA